MKTSRSASTPPEVSRLSRRREEPISGIVRLEAQPAPGEADDGEGVLFWYGATRIAKAENSRRYRIENRLERLPRARSFVGRWLPADLLEDVHTVIVLRPYLDRSTREQLDALRRRGIRLVADFDDLLFDCPLSDFPPAEKLFHRPRMALRLRAYRAGLGAFDAFTCSTEPIAEALRRLRPDAPVRTVPNVPSPCWIERGWDRYGHLAWRPGDPKVMRYLPGSPSHDRDFAVVEDVLAEFMRAHADVELEVVGYLKFRRSKFPRDRVRQRAKVRYDELPAILLSTWVNLVPLAPNVYSASRSALKFLEAAAFDVPTIATPSADLLRVADERVLAARSASDWRHHLELLGSEPGQARTAFRRTPRGARSERIQTRSTNS